MISAEMTSRGILGMRKRDFFRLFKKSLAYLGKRWHTRFRKRHFSQSAYTLYSYTPRKRAYNRAKLKYLGHTRPLEKSGAAKRQSGSKKVTATRKGVTVKMPIRVANLRAKNSRINMRKEITTVINSEESALERDTVLDFEKRLNRFRQNRRF